MDLWSDLTYCKAISYVPIKYWTVLGCNLAANKFSSSLYRKIQNRTIYRAPEERVGKVILSTLLALTTEIFKYVLIKNSHNTITF